MVDPEDPTKVRTSPLCRADDLMVAGWNSDKVKLSAHLNESFETKLLGELTHYSGCTFVRDWEKGTLLIHQKLCFEKMAEMFGMKIRRYTSAYVLTDLRPKEATQEEVERSFRQLVAGRM